MLVTVVFRDRNGDRRRWDRKVLGEEEGRRDRLEANKKVCF